MKRIKTGKYRYRGHIIWFDRHDLQYHCNPDPSCLWDVSRPTLRKIKEYIDDWEIAFEEGRVDGNFILMSEETARELADAIMRTSKALAESSMFSIAVLEKISRDLLSITI